MPEEVLHSRNCFPNSSVMPFKRVTFQMLGRTVTGVHFLWKRRSWFSRDNYASLRTSSWNPVVFALWWYLFPLSASSDMLDAGEMDVLTYQDQEAEK